MFASGNLPLKRPLIMSTFDPISLSMKIIDLLEQNGAKDVMIVGGFVRDRLLGIPSKDVDIEVYGLSYSEILKILAPSFHVDLVGKAFGVIKVGNVVDVALPRRESKNGFGHKGFDVEAVSDLNPYEAFARRDFTINAIGMRRDGSYFDPFNGIADLKKKILRATSSAFKDDPLRVLRGMQFAARFGVRMDSKTIQFCRDVFDEFSTLPEERVYEEWKKWALKGVFPDLGLDVLRETGWVLAFPELEALIGCPQNPSWHPEGDVWNHTKLVCHEAAKAIRKYSPPLNEDERVIIMFASLCHDFGKPLTTKLDETGILRSQGHATASAPLARKFLERMKAPNRIVNAVEPLVLEHMATQNDDVEPSARAVRRLAKRLSPANIKLWALLCQSDALGCGATERYYAESQLSNEKDVARQFSSFENESSCIRFKTDLWLRIARELDISEKEPQPLVQGKDLLAIGVKPGPSMGKLLKFLFEEQIDGKFLTKQKGVERARELLNE